MLTIRKEQWRALNAPFVETFERNAVRYIAESQPAKYAEMGDAKARELVREAMAMGARYSVEYEDDLEALAVIFARLYPARFEATAWAMEVLADRTLPPDARVGLLAARMGD